MNNHFTGIDIEFERIIFLCNSEEGNEGLFDLINELGYHNISDEEKLSIAKQALTPLIQEGLLKLDRFEKITDSQPIETISLANVEEVLSNLSSWNFSGENVLAVTLTDTGMDYLDKNYPRYEERIQERWFGGGNPNIARIIARP